MVWTHERCDGAETRVGGVAAVHGADSELIKHSGFSSFSNEHENSVQSHVYAAEIIIKEQR